MHTGNNNVSVTAPVGLVVASNTGSVSATTPMPSSSGASASAVPQNTLMQTEESEAEDMEISDGDESTANVTRKRPHEQDEGETAMVKYGKVELEEFVSVMLL